MPEPKKFVIPDWVWNEHPTEMAFYEKMASKYGFEFLRAPSETQLEAEMLVRNSAIASWNERQIV